MKCLLGRLDLTAFLKLILSLYLLFCVIMKRMKSIFNNLNCCEILLNNNIAELFSNGYNKHYNGNKSKY